MQRRHVPVFVAGPPIASCGAFVCYECLTNDERRRLRDDDVEVWEECSSGWMGPCLCERCNLSIPVYVDGPKSILLEILEQSSAAR